MPNLIKQNISRVLFLIYFSIYAVSPLSHTLTLQNDLELYSSNRSNHSTNNLHIFVWEIIFSKLTRWNETSNDHEGTGVRTLIRKARAILPEDISKKSSSLQKASLIEPMSFYTSQISSQYFLHYGVRRTTKAIGPLYAGHSPPFYNRQS